jgi:hypothetical protein
MIALVAAGGKIFFLRRYQLSVTESGLSGYHFSAFVSPPDAGAFPLVEVHHEVVVSH